MGLGTCYTSSEITARGSIEIDRGRLAATWIGPGPEQAPTLVFLHEGLGCIGMWKDVPARLVAATGCGALVYTRFGYAQSDPCPLPRTTAYLHTEALEVLPQVLAACAIRDAILVGHSDGGSIALLYAGTNPTPGLRAAITLGAHVFVEDLSVESIAATRARYESGELRRSLEKYHGAGTDRAYWGWFDIWTLPAFKLWNIEDCLPGIRVPLLVIQGEDDPYGTRAQVDAIARRCGAPVETLLLPGCRHWPHLEQPGLSLPAMQAFIARSASGR
jgi:pimeloyl-ACP methyl ester carboxylesterase